VTIIAQMFDDSDGRRATGDAIEQVIAGMPNLLSLTRIPKYGAAPVTVVHSQRAVASRITSVLPELLRERGFVVVRLSAVRLDDFGCPSVRVFLSDRPWADGEVYVQADRLVWTSVPARVLLQDAPAVAAALLAVHDAARRPPNDVAGKRL